MGSPVEAKELTCTIKNIFHSRFGRKLCAICHEPKYLDKSVQVIGFLKSIVSGKECRQRFNRHLSAIWYRWDDLELDDHSILRVSVRPHMASQIPQNRIQQADLDIIACSI